MHVLDGLVSNEITIQIIMVCADGIFLQASQLIKQLYLVINWNMAPPLELCTFPDQTFSGNNHLA